MATIFLIDSIPTTSIEEIISSEKNIQIFPLNYETAKYLKKKNIDFILPDTFLQPQDYQLSQ